MPVNKHIKQLMLDLEKAFVEAASTSTDIGDAVRRIRHEGYTLHLVLDRQEESASRTQIELIPQRPSSKEAAFILDKGDVSMLRSLGIDPTRSGRRRRTS